MSFREIDAERLPGKEGAGDPAEEESGKHVLSSAIPEDARIELAGVSRGGLLCRQQEEGGGGGGGRFFEQNATNIQHR